MKRLFNLKIGAVGVVMSSIVVYAVTCNAQSIRMSPPDVKPLPANYASMAPSTPLPMSDVSRAYDLTKSLPAGYVTDGSVDYTDYLQKGINANGDVVFPDFPVQVGIWGLTFKSNTDVFFKPNSVIKMVPNNKTSYTVVRIEDLSNTNFYNMRIEGDRNQHTGNGGEWGMGISMRGCTNVRLLSPVVSECWGDGIYLGSSKKGLNKDIKIENARLDHNRRNGISIIAVDGLMLKNAVISNTMGTAPMAGIDIEPNDNSNIIDNITIDAPVTYNNGRFGIVVSLGELPGDVAKNVNITVNNHTDDGSTVAFSTALGATKDKGCKALTGNLQVNNPNWINTRQQCFMNFKRFNTNLQVNYQGIKNSAARRQMRNDLSAERLMRVN